MMTDERAQLLFILKALSEESRLDLLRLMQSGERAVGELAAALALTEPTISHHLSRLREAGLVSLRTAGNQRYYRINPAGLAKFKDLSARIESLQPLERVPRSAETWIDQLDWSDEDKKILRAHVQNGVLISLPLKPKRTDVILRWVITKFDSQRHYTEAEVNEVLKVIYKQDYVSIRRDLVDYGYLRRERGGGDYWVTPENEKHVN